MTVDGSHIYWTTLFDDTIGRANLSGASATPNFIAVEASGPGIAVTPADHTVTFNANGGTGAMAPQATNVPAALTSNAFTRTGYTFAGWNTTGNGTGTGYADQAVYPFATDTTLYAQWTPLPTRTVTFNANGGTGAMTPQTTNVPAALTARAFTRTGYTFTGWNTTANGTGTGYADQAVYPFATDTTLYAQWTAAAAPGKVKSVTAKAKRGKVIVKWAAAKTPVTGYVVKYSTNKKKWKKAGTTSPSKTKLVWKKGKKGKTYHLRVAAKSHNGKGPWSKTVKIKAR